jgi:hypothetical protein
LTRRNNFVSDGVNIVGGAKVTQGGTGATSANTALLNLGAVSKDLIDQALGPISLGPNGLPDASIFTGISVIDTAIDGERFIGIRETKEYFITTFDAFTDYVVEAVDGEVGDRRSRYPLHSAVSSWKLWLYLMVALCRSQ